MEQNDGKWARNVKERSVKHAVRWNDLHESAQVCNTSQSCHELELSHTHGCVQSAIKCGTPTRLRQCACDDVFCLHLLPRVPGLQEWARGKGEKKVQILLGRTKLKPSLVSRKSLHLALARRLFSDFMQEGPVDLDEGVLEVYGVYAWDLRPEAQLRRVHVHRGKKFLGCGTSCSFSDSHWAVIISNPFF